MMKNLINNSRLRAYGRRLTVAVCSMITLLIAQPSLCPAFAGEETKLRAVAMLSDAAPAALGGTYSKIHASSISDSGDVAFSASLAGAASDGAIILKSGDETRALLRSGEQAPEGGRYRSFHELDLSNITWLGQEGIFLIFRAELEGGSASEGIFLWTPGGVSAVAIAGAHSSRGSRYKSFAQPSVLATTANEGVGYYLAFSALLEDGRQVFIDRSQYDTSLQEFPATGDSLGADRQGNPVLLKSFTISSMGALGVNGVATLHTPSDNKSFQEMFFMNTAFIIRGGAIRQGGKLKGIGKIKRILNTPGISFQNGYAAVQLKGGTSALVFRDVLGSSAVIARTGAAAPGVAGETLESFTSPVGNNAYAFSDGKTGIASVVRLSGGRAAIWSFQTESSFPELTGSSRIILIEGDAVGDSQGEHIESFSLVKLNNAGSLLLRATVGDGGATREGLFILTGVLEAPASALN